MIKTVRHTIEVEVEVRVTGYTPDDPGVWGGPPERWVPPEMADVEYDVVDPETGKDVELPQAAERALYDLIMESMGED
jgi:hypothetical protein